MKKFFAVTTSLIATLCALSFGGAAAAYAGTDGSGEDTSATQFYPKSFETVPVFDNLEDYAVGGNVLLFLENNVIYEYGNEHVETYKNSRKNITNLYYEGDAFYYRTDDNCYYALENFKETEPKPEENFTSTVKTDNVTLNGFNYYFNIATGVLKVNNLSTDEITSLDGFSSLKQYGEKAYSVRTTDDGKNVLCTLNGTEKNDVKVKNFDLVKNTGVGNAYNALTVSATQDVQFVSLTNGAYMTEVDLDKLTKKSSTFFAAGDDPVTVKVNTADTPFALLLYSETDGGDGISIIAVNGKSYLIHPMNASLNTIYPPKDLNKDGTATAGYIYSVPFESAGTRIKNSAGEDAVVSGSVKIIKEIKKADYPELDGDFYFVEYKTDDGITVKGYVRHGLISTYIFNEDPPVATPDPDATTEDLIKPVVLVLIVLLLIAIAAGYLIYVGTSDKRKKKNAAAKNDNEQNK